MKLFKRNKQECEHSKKHNSDISEEAFEKCIEEGIVEEVKKKTPTVIQPFDSRLHLKEDVVREIRQKVMNGTIHNYPLITMNTSRFCTKIQDLLYEYYKDTEHTLDEDIHKSINYKAEIKLILIDYDTYKIMFKSIKGNWYSCKMNGLDFINITDIQYGGYSQYFDHFLFQYIIKTKDCSQLTKPYFINSKIPAVSPKIEYQLKDLYFERESNE